MEENAQNLSDVLYIKCITMTLSHSLHHYSVFISRYLKSSAVHFPQIGENFVEQKQNLFMPLAIHIKLRLKQNVPFFHDVKVSLFWNLCHEEKHEIKHVNEILKSVKY